MQKKNELQKIEKQQSYFLKLLSAMATDDNIHELASTYTFILREKIGVDRFALFVQKDQEDWELVAKAGIKRKECVIDVEQELFRFATLTWITSSTSVFLSNFDVVLPISHQGKILSYLLIKHDRNELKKISDLTLQLLQMCTHLLVVTLENKRFIKHNLLQERLHNELELASAMQQFLFPAELPSNAWFDLAAKYIPRYEVGGDYYDFIPISKKTFVMCIGDVSGKGLGAALLMANFQATVRGLFLHQKEDIELMIRQLNKKVLENAQGEHFISCFIAHFNVETRRLRYINAGHSYPILTDGKKIQMLKKGCIGLGIFDPLPFIEIGELFLAPNSTLICYTDGVVELENKEKIQFGLDRLIRIVHANYSSNMTALTEQIFGKLDEWKQELPLVDDTAVFACRIM